MSAIEKFDVVNYTTVRSILRRYMADYSNSDSAPTGIKSGFFAVHMHESNKVWLGETDSFKTVLTNIRNKAKMAHCINEAKKRGEKLSIWFLTKPAQFSAQQLEDELFKLDVLSYRKERICDGPGKIYCIRHSLSNDYFIAADRINLEPSTILGQYLSRLNRSSALKRNELLNKFINDNVSDILKGTGFTITLIDKFNDRDDERVKRNIYITQSKFGKNLNLLEIDSDSNY